METLEMGGNCKPLTTFVHADTSTFQEVVQRLTGAGPYQTHTQHAKSSPATSISSRKPTTASSMSKLHERRQCIKPKLDIVKPTIINSHFKSSSPLVSPSTIFSKLSIAEEESRGGSAAAASITTPGKIAKDTTRAAYLVSSNIPQIRTSKSMISFTASEINRTMM